ncbi:outer membrane protein [Bradyrhizobium yuanmingense]|uniref:outer membrane protein n=1 Tax=Bradyrhizobium TaxID=374 RepID=UPI000A47B2AC|nr:outer membrane beta-barrel protein [Bradyrhizobium yuanmingense]MCA1473736.1 porin family protein [Bradyrhizobium sp. NBAIM08]
MRRALAAVAVLASVASGAEAADQSPAIFTKARTADSSPSWTGFYAGGNVGGAWADRSVNFTSDAASAFIFNPGVPILPPFAGQVAPSPHDFSMSGVTGGLQAGYNWQLDSKWLVGVEADLSGSSLRGGGRETTPILPPAFTQTISAEQKIDWWGSVRGRLGALVTPSVLLYGTGGFAFGRVATFDDYIVNGPGGALSVSVTGTSFSCTIGSTCFTGNDSRIQTGWTVGGGGEWRFAPGWSFKAEYLYVDLGKSSVTANALATGIGPNLSRYTANFGRADFHVARVGVNYHF